VVSKQNCWLCRLGAWPAIKVTASVVGERHVLSVRQVTNALQNLRWRQDAMIDAQLTQTTKANKLTVTVGETKTKRSLRAAKLLVRRRRRISSRD
jgi:hypothetical protein